MHVRTASRWFQALSWAALGVVGAAGALRWWFATAAWMPPALALHLPADGLSVGQQLAGFAVEMIPFAAALYTVLALNTICARYARGELFAARIGTAYRALGKGLLFLGLANGLYITLATAVVTYAPERPQLALAVGLSLADLYLLIVGGALMMLGHVMDEARRLQQENSEFV